MSDALSPILRDKRDEVRRRMDAVALAAIRKRAFAAASPRDFAAALRVAIRKRGVAAIAEMKSKSPSGGVLVDADSYRPAAAARAYEAGGAAALSVLTDAAYFGGASSHLRAAKRACGLPVLRKDFIVAEWQVYESRAIGADAILLIAAALPPPRISAFAALAASLRMAALVEVHNREELKAVLPIAADKKNETIIIGINSRDLRTLKTDLQTAQNLAPQARAELLKKNRSKPVIVAESGIKTAADIQRLRAAGANAFLIGESLLCAANPADALRGMFSFA